MSNNNTHVQRAELVRMAPLHELLIYLLLYGGISKAIDIERHPQGGNGLQARVQRAEARIGTRRHPAGIRKLAHDQILLDAWAPISEVDPQFLSVTIDAGDISRNWSGITFTAQRIINMARGLVPAMLRVGGTSGDYLIFNSTADETGN